MTVSIISTDKAPAAVGPYSQAVRVAQIFPAGEGSIIYVSGQVGLDPATGKLVDGGMEAQARQAFKNLAAVAEEAGASLAHAVKLTLFLTDLSQFAAVNAIMKQMVPEPFPARSTIGVAALPLGASFEVEGVFAA
jgi:2-iminobutanoate/2-iminopropanoate deaminase